MWINVGNGNLYGAGASEFYASYNSINSPQVSESNYGNNAGDWDNILIEGTAAIPASEITLVGAKAHDAAVPSYPAHGVHLKYVSNSSVTGVEWSGGALSSPQQSQPDLGGMAVEKLVTWCRSTTSIATNPMGRACRWWAATMSWRQRSSP